MRTRCTISATFAALAIAFAAAGCNSTTQPTSAPVQTASLAFATTAQVDLYNCWEVWADGDGDGVIEDQFQLSCDQIFQESGPPAQVQVPAPWHYSLAITVIPAGQTQERIIAASIIPGDSIEDFVSLTPYDPAFDTGATKASDGVHTYVTPGGVPPSGASKVVSNASRLWLEGNGYNLGEPNVLEHTPTYNVNLNQGDTIIVRARKQKLSDAPPWLPDDTPKQLELVGTLTIQGVQVPLQGTSASPGSDMTGVTFSYTKQ